MLELVPCVACSRHVSVRETTCPFCSNLLPPRRARYAVPRGLARAAVFSAALASCSSPKDRAAPPSGSAAHQGSDDLEKLLDPSPGTGAREARAPVADAAVADTVSADATVDAGSVDAGIPLHKKKVEHTRKKIDPDKVIRHERIPNNKPYGAPPARRRVV